MKLVDISHLPYDFIDPGEPTARIVRLRSVEHPVPTHPDGPVAAFICDRRYVHLDRRCVPTPVAIEALDLDAKKHQDLRCGKCWDIELTHIPATLLTGGEGHDIDLAPWVVFVSFFRDASRWPARTAAGTRAMLASLYRNAPASWQAATADLYAHAQEHVLRVTSNDGNGIAEQIAAVRTDRRRISTDPLCPSRKWRTQILSGRTFSEAAQECRMSSDWDPEAANRWTDHVTSRIEDWQSLGRHLVVPVDWRAFAPYGNEAIGSVGFGFAELGALIDSAAIEGTMLQVHPNEPPGLVVPAIVAAGLAYINDRSGRPVFTDAGPVTEEEVALLSTPSGADLLETVLALGRSGVGNGLTIELARTML